MDNAALVAFVYWPAAVLLASLINMLTWKTFSWSELLFDYLAGVLVGTFFFVGTERDAGGLAKVLMVGSQGIFGLFWLGDAFADRAQMFWISACLTVGATLLATLLDHAALSVGTKMSAKGGVLSAFIWLVKAPFSLFTTAVGLVFFLVGIVRTLVGTDGRVGFLGGQLYVEWDTSKSYDSATTLGTTIQTWTGSLSGLLKHELFHSRQYIYYHDWLIPLWLVGGIWGWVSSAIDGTFRIKAFSAARHDKEVGNPLEQAPYQISGYSNI